jgi:hypothetical protein
VIASSRVAVGKDTVEKRRGENVPSCATSSSSAEVPAQMGEEMATKRVLIISNELMADRPESVPEVVWKQVQAADEVRVVVPALTGRLKSWVSDIDGAILDADTRMQELVGDITSDGHPGIHGRVGDEDPLLAVEDALADFPADALIISVHPSNQANWRERRLREKVRERFGLPVTEMILDRDGRVVSVTTD